MTDGQTYVVNEFPHDGTWHSELLRGEYLAADSAFLARLLVLCSEGWTIATRTGLWYYELSRGTEGRTVELAHL